MAAVITDRHGNELNRGDEVTLRARVLSTFESGGAQSIVVAILSPAHGEGTRFGVRSDEIEKATRGSFEMGQSPADKTALDVLTGERS